MELTERDIDKLTDNELLGHLKCTRGNVVKFTRTTHGYIDDYGKHVLIRDFIDKPHYITDDRGYYVSQ